MTWRVGTVESMTGPLKFTLHEFVEGINERRIEIGAEGLEIAASGCKVLERITIELEIARARMEVRVRGKAHLRLQQPCDRCLKPAECSLDVPLEVLARERPTREASTAEAPEGILYHNGEGFSLFDEVREAVVVALPQHPLCRSDCRGLCPQCGADLNEGGCDCPASETADPRWAALGDLKVGRSGGGPENKTN